MGVYTNPNFRCSTAGCGHFVADHKWDDTRTDEEKDAGAAHDNEQTRGACHANGLACVCKDYTDSGSEDERTAAPAVSTASAELTALQAKVDAAKKKKLEAELAALDAGN